MSLPSISVVVFEDDSTRTTTLKELCQGRAGVIDFWTTKCVRCPAALGKLNEEAGEADKDKFMYIACALSQGEGNQDDVQDFISDWDNLTHVFVDLKDKEAVKSTFGFSAVPFYVVFDQNGTIVGKGEPKAFDYQSVLANVETAENIENKLENIAVQNTNTFSLDEDF